MIINQKGVNMGNKKALLEAQIRLLTNENEARRKEIMKLHQAADPAEGFLSEVALMPQLDQKVRDAALKHREALRESIEMFRRDYT